MNIWNVQYSLTDYKFTTPQKLFVFKPRKKLNDKFKIYQQGFLAWCGLTLEIGYYLRR